MKKILALVLCVILAMLAMPAALADPGGDPNENAAITVTPPAEQQAPDSSPGSSEFGESMADNHGKANSDGPGASGAARY